VSEPRRFLPLLAATAALILLHQVLDLATLLPGSDLGTPAGRVRQLLALAARSPGLLVADLLLIWAAIGWGATGGLRKLAVAHLVLGVVLLVLLPFFLLDAGRVAGTFGGAESVAFRVITARTLLVLSLFGAGSLVASRTLRSLSQSPRGPP
jgi:hypothetical protein